MAIHVPWITGRSWSAVSFHVLYWVLYLKTCPNQPWGIFWEIELCCSLSLKLRKYATTVFVILRLCVLLCERRIRNYELNVQRALVLRCFSSTTYYIHYMYTIPAPWQSSCPKRLDRYRNRISGRDAHGESWIVPNWWQTKSAKQKDYNELHARASDSVTLDSVGHVDSCCDTQIH